MWLDHIFIGIYNQWQSCYICCYHYYYMHIIWKSWSFFQYKLFLFSRNCFDVVLSRVLFSLSCATDLSTCIGIVNGLQCPSMTGGGFCSCIVTIWSTWGSPLSNGLSSLCSTISIGGSPRETFNSAMYCASFHVISLPQRTMWSKVVLCSSAGKMCETIWLGGTNSAAYW